MRSRILSNIAEDELNVNRNVRNLYVSIMYILYILLIYLYTYIL